ncbi:MAG TPA: alanyl-tRNA editing protein [Anaerolineae bacterium]|nr:alanyl-tRNA editing protein [Anaerolineae bacterium]
MTKYIYQNDSYIKSFTAQVTAVDTENHALQLDQTAFYPGGGGQLPDAGILYVNEEVLSLKRARMIKGEHWHFLKEEAVLPGVGEEVQGEIDWERRYKIMRTHTAMHILCGVIFRDYGALVTGGNMDILKARMDFEFESMSKELVQVIEEAINKEVQAAHEVWVANLPREEAFKIPDLIRTKINLLPEHIQQVRTVEIVGLDLQADGGTHVHNTREVGKIKVVDYKSKGKINKRIYVELES